MNILDLPLKAIWYNMIESGKKKEEYREHNSYWAKRFYACYDKKHGLQNLYSRKVQVLLQTIP